MIFPYVPKALLDHLREVYPPRPPRLSDSEREIWMDAGEQRLIDSLHQIWKAQEAGTDQPTGLPNVLLVLPVVGSGSDPDPGIASASGPRSSGSPGHQLRD